MCLLVCISAPNCFIAWHKSQTIRVTTSCVDDLFNIRTGAISSWEKGARATRAGIRDPLNAPMKETAVFGILEIAVHVMSKAVYRENIIVNICIWPANKCQCPTHRITKSYRYTTCNIKLCLRLYLKMYLLWTYYRSFIRSLRTLNLKFGDMHIFLQILRNITYGWK